MPDPLHPWAILREDILPAPGLTITDAVAQSAVRRVAFARGINEHASLSAIWHGDSKPGFEAAKPYTV